MKKKIIAGIIISILIIVCISALNSINALTHKNSVRQLLEKSYDTLINFKFGDFEEEDWLYDDDPGIICVHDWSYDKGLCGHPQEERYDEETGELLYVSNCNCQYQLKHEFSGWYRYYDRIVFNPNGKQMTGLLYNNAEGKSAGSYDYGKDVTFLSRMFYECRTDVEKDNWGLIQEYRLFCMNHMSQNFKNSLKKVSGSFRYFIHEEELSYNGNEYAGIGHYSQEGKEVYIKSDVYSKFINNLSNKYTIANKNYININDAKNSKVETLVDTNKKWTITVNAPYYKKNNYYDGVKYEYQFVNSSNNESTEFLSATAKLASGQSGNGYKKVEISGNANTITSADTLVIKCTYPTYTGLAMGFATGSGQERFLVSGKTNEYVSYIAYKLKKDPNVTVTKNVKYINTTDVLINKKSANVERGDTVLFEIQVNNTGSETKINLADTIPAGLTFVRYKDSITREWSTNWNGLSNVTISSNGKIIIYLVCKVNNDAKGTIKNIATVTPVRGNQLNKGNVAKLEDSASVTVLDYDYSLKKTVNKDNIEVGDIIEYTITLTNKNDTYIRDMIIEDKIPEGLEYVDCTANDKWDISQTNGIVKFTRKSGKLMGKGSNNFTITCKVSEEYLSKTENTKITNTATLKQVKNKNQVDLEKKKASVSINVLYYDYSITKVVNAIYKKDGKTLTGNTEVAEPGEIIEYKITVNNTGTADIYVSLTDMIETSISNKILLDLKNDKDSVKYNNQKVSANKSKEFTIKTVKISTITNENYTVTNTATLNSVKNKNNVEIMKESGNSASATVTILGYNANLNKYITKHNGKSINDRIGKTDIEKNNNPVVVKKGDTVTYTIKFKNTDKCGTTLYNPQIVDTLKPGLEYQSHSEGWTRDKNTYTYNGDLKAGKEISLDITAKVTMSNIHLFNIENIATYGAVENINGIIVKDILTLKNNKDYIRLDELDIVGTVWEDTNKDGVMNEEEPRLEGIKVILHNETDKTTIEKTTDSNGYYKFDKESEVLKGTARDANGNYQEGVSEHKKYYIEYIYDGLTYKSTQYSGKSKLDSADLSVTEDYKIASNAREIDEERNAFNEKFKVIYNNTAIDSSGNTTNLSYKQIDGKTVLQQRENYTMSSYSFGKEMMWLIGSDKSNVENPDTEYLGYINLGLVNKEADLELYTKVDAIILTINGQRLEYIRPEEYGDNYGGGIHSSDYDYKYDVRYSDNEDIKNFKGEESELNAEIRYMTRVKNTGNCYATLNEITQAYDPKFVEVYGNDGTTQYTQEMKIDRNDDGILDNENFVYKFEPYYEHYEYKDTNEDDIVEKILKSDGKINGTLTKKYPGAYNNDENPHIVYLTGMENIYLAPGETIEIFTTYIMKKDDKGNITVDLNLEDKEGCPYRIISEINSYSTYDYDDDERRYRLAGSVDIDSNPGSLKMNVGEDELTYATSKEDDADHIAYSPSRFVGTSSRKIEGTVWEDTNKDGVMDSSEPRIKNVKVKLIEIIKYEDSRGNICFKEYEVDVNPTATGDARKYDLTDENGDYELRNYIPGLYVIRFIYGDDINDLKYNGHDYKSTKYVHDDVENFEEGNNNTVQIAPSYESRVEVNTDNIYPQRPELTGEIETYQELAEHAKTKEKRVSDARDDEKRRLEVMNYSLEMYNEKAEILKGNDSSKKDELVTNTQMYAETATFLTKIEVIPAKTKIKKEDGTETDEYPIADYIIHIGDLLILDKDGNEVNKGRSMWYKSNANTWRKDLETIINAGGNKGNSVAHMWKEWRGENLENSLLYQRNITYKYIDFGLQKRPENKLELQKYIKQIKLETSTGELLVDLYYNENSELLKPFSKGFENVQALNNTSTQQGFRHINVDEDLLQGAKITIKYGFIATNNSENDYISKNLYGEEDEFESKTTKNILDDIKNATNSIDDNKKYLDSKNYYGYYLGNNYYKGTPGSNDVKAQLKIDNILDYVDNNLVFKPDENEGKWGTIKKDELISNGYLQEDVYMIGGHKLVADINGVEYQTDTKNNLAITIDDKTTNPNVSKFLLPKSIDPDAKIETDLTVSTILSPENNTDDMVYENIAEIIKYTSMNGRRTVKEGSDAHTVGNAKIHLAGYKNDDDTLREPDTAITEFITLAPPTGIGLIDIYTITKILIYIINIITIIGVAIIIIPRIKRKMKSRY